MPTNPLATAVEQSEPFLPKSLEPETTGLQIITAADFFGSPPPPRKYLLDDVLPLGEVGMIVGAGGIGKSMLALQLAMGVVTGDSVCNGLYPVTSPGGVLIVNAEDDQQEFHRRVWHFAQSLAIPSGTDAANCTGIVPPEVLKNADRLKFCSLKGRPASFIDENGDISEVYEQVLGAASHIPDLRLIVVDPLRRMYGGSEDSSDTAARLIPLIEKLAKETGATVLLVHHLSKQSAKNASLDQYAAKGSGAFTDLVRWQLNIAPPKNIEGTGLSKDSKHEYLEISVSKNNYGPPQKRRLFLQRGDNGVLRYVHSSGHLSKLDADVKQVLAVVKSQMESGKVFSRTELKNQKQGLGLDMGDKAIRDAIDHAIQHKLLTEVPRPNHKGQGKVPKDLLPGEMAHPNS